MELHSHNFEKIIKRSQKDILLSDTNQRRTTSIGLVLHLLGQDKSLTFVLSLISLQIKSWRFWSKYIREPLIKCGSYNLLIILVPPHQTMPLLVFFTISLNKLPQNMSLKLSVLCPTLKLSAPCPISPIDCRLPRQHNQLPHLHDQRRLLHRHLRDLRGRVLQDHQQPMLGVSDRLPHLHRVPDHSAPRPLLQLLPHFHPATR